MHRLRRLLLPSLLILALAATGGIAQTINKALQLSQDGTGAFGVDTTNNVYFPGHFLNTGASSGTPSISSGATTPTCTNCTDVAGTITVNAAATTATVTFARAYVTAPTCLVSAPVVATAATGISWTTATTSLALTWSGAAGTVSPARYFCTGPS
jgi:hypothetical protein